MLTLAFTNRNKPYASLERCFSSLRDQSDTRFQIYLLDYGSDENGRIAVMQIAKEFPVIQLITCDTQEQLWNKSRSLNVILKKCETPYFFVGDVDMIFHPDFVAKALEMASSDSVHYFQVGFLSEEESKTKKAFEAYQINFTTNEEATGMTLYPTDLLKEIGGYDEFYHGWGFEDTDVHVRLRNKGVNVHFHKESTLMLHQWHAKTYRSKESSAPYHPYLERINQAYLEQVRSTKKVKANTQFAWGEIPTSMASTIEVDHTLQITNRKNEVSALLQTLAELNGNLVQVMIQPDPEKSTPKTKVKKLLGKHTPQFLEMETVNELLLEHLILCCRNKSYSFSFDRTEATIHLTIQL